MANETPSDDAAAPPSGKGKLIIIILIVVLVLAIGGGVAAYFLLFQGDSAEDGEAAETAAAEQTAPTSPQAGQPPMTPLGPVVYRELQPMTVNFANSDSMRFLRIGITVMTRSQEMADAIEKHQPMIRNDFMLYLAAQDPAELSTAEGKDKLRDELQQMLIGLLTRAGEPVQIDGLLFTDLVMQ